jgi:hypothetical protein
MSDSCYYDENKNKDKKDKINQYSDIFNYVCALLALVLNSVNQQKGQNIVLTSGNNNEIQIPQEEGKGDIVQD